jgi:CubicO group peptidase (beta-lactamase class C family)
MAILRDGKIVSTRVHGPVTLETNFRLASVTKQFTAAAIAVLVRRGAMDYDTPDARGITIRHLLNHTSGLADYEELLAPDRTEQVHDEEVVQLIAEAPLLFAPGSRFRYSNSGYVLLGVLLERASGMSLEQFFEEELFKPLGMQGTTLGPANNRAYGTPHDQSVTSATRGDGNVYSNVLDLARWMANGPVVGDTVDADVPDTRYGFGWYVRGNRVWHCGDTAGFRTAIVSEGNRTVIALTNSEPAARSS